MIENAAEFMYERAIAFPSRKLIGVLVPGSRLHDSRLTVGKCISWVRSEVKADATRLLINLKEEIKLRSMMISDCSLVPRASCWVLI